MPRFKISLLHVLSNLLVFSQATTLRADGPQTAATTPKGEVTRYVFEQSKIFPGTVRDYWIYVPKQYDPANPACVYVNQDGVHYHAPNVFDELIHKQQRFYHLHVPDTADDAGADGIRVDRDGRLDVATRMGIQICDQAGRVNCIIPTPNGKVANLCFGGADFQTLFATCGEAVYKRKLKVKGASAFLAPFKPAPPRL
jgi:hypothetical protein